MRAVIADQAGPPGVLIPVELPDPEPGTGQVLITVYRAAVTFIETQLRAGLSIGPNVTFPVVFGNGVMGVIEAVGDDVDEDWIGTSVVTSVGGTGGYATKVVAAEKDLHRIPEGLDPADAVALLADGRTAVGLFRAADVKAGDTVVVTAAAGGVGGLLVQLACRAGATVIALAGDQAKLDHAAGLGADVGINYRAAGWADELAKSMSEGPDVVFDGVGGHVTAAISPLARKGTRYLTQGAASGTWASIDEADASDRGIIVIPLTAIGNGRDDMFQLTEDALALAAAGDLHVTIGQTYPLERAADAHAAIEDRATIGKTLLLA